MLASGRVRKSGSGAAYDAAMAVAVVFKQKMATLAFNITADRRDSAHASGIESRVTLSRHACPWRIRHGQDYAACLVFFKPGIQEYSCCCCLI